MEYFPDLLRAAIFTAEKHTGQTRKYTGEPYINHPIAVATLVESVGGNSRMLMAALLHDTIEDCGVTPDELRRKFGLEVAQLVTELTDASKKSDGNREKRKAIDREHYSRASVDAKTIKLADLIDNTFSITEHDPKFADVYMMEKKLLLPNLSDGNSRLYQMALAQVARWEAKG